jgi:probable phosphoglycerate mutase
MIATTHFGLLRHAETVWNRERRIQGQQDSPLTAEGLARAEGWGRWLKQGLWTRIVASDLGRAHGSAEAINRSLALPLTLDPRLREQDWGEWTGRRMSEIRARDAADLAAAGAGWDFQPPGGERRRMVLARGRQALMDAARAWPGELILVVSHEGMLKSLLYDLMERDPAVAAGVRLSPGCLHRLRSDGLTLRLAELNAHVLP